jgi:hypothetical protein
MNTVDKTALKEIWLNVGDEGTYQDAVDAACGISWCQYKIDANDVKYVLASSQAATIAEQLLTIQALNLALGGEGTLTTDNLVRISRLEAELFDYKVEVSNTLQQLQLENQKLREALEVCKYDCHTGEVINIAKEALGETK